MALKSHLLMSCMVIAAFSNIGDAFCQQNYFMPSPGSEALIRNVGNEVNHFTGIANVMVPLHTVSYGDMTVPISLNYQASGIKLDDEATAVGLGWNLSCGGKVTRIVKGLPDEATGGYCNNWRFTSAIDLLYGIFDGKEVNQDIDGEPDIFYYEIPGLSGMFVFDHNGNAITIPYQDISIEWTNRLTPVNSEIIIKDNTGKTYVFGGSRSAKEVTTASIDGPKKSKVVMYISTWHLETIKDVNDREITFSYQDTGFKDKTSKTFIHDYRYDEYPARLYITGTKEYTYFTSIDTKLIKEINYGHGKVCFVKENDFLSDVVIYNSNTDIIKKLRLQYDFFGHTHLKSIFDITSSQELICSFEYNRNVNPSGRKGHDFWGYPNGQVNRDEKPIFQINGFTVRDASLYSQEPSLEYSQAYILKEVKYPTGAKIRYEYELNSGNSNDFSPYGKKVGGLRVKSISHISEVGDIRTTLYEYAEGIPHTRRVINGTCSSWHESSVVSFFGYFSNKPLNDITSFLGSPVMYPTVTEIHPNGSRTIYSYSTASNDLYADTKSWIYVNKYLKTSVISSTIHLSNEVSEFDYVFQDNPKFWKRGLLLSVTKYAADAPSHPYLYDYKETYTYNTTSAVKGSVYGYIPFFEQTLIEDRYHKLLCEYQWESQPVFVEKIVVDQREGGILQSETRFEYNLNHVVPVKIETTDAEGNVTGQKTGYSFDYASNSQAWIKQLQNRNIVTPIEVVQYQRQKGSSQNYITGATLGLYTTDSGTNLPYDFAVPERTKALFVDQPLPEGSFRYTTTNPNSHDSRYEVQAVFTGYDPYGNLLSMKMENGIPLSFQYGYNNTLIIAEVTNSEQNRIQSGGRYNKFFHTSFEDSPLGVISAKSKTGKRIWNSAYTLNLQNMVTGEYILTYWRSPDSGQTWTKITEPLTITTGSTTKVIGGGGPWIDEVRLIPVDALITTYTYLPGVGKLTEMDHNGQVMYWEYDSRGRLSCIRDSDRNAIKVYEYNAPTN